MQLHLENKVVVVTGSASGIAKSAARIFLEEGAKVAMLDMNEAGLANALAEFGPLAKNAKTFLCNVSDEQNVHDTFAAVAGYFGGIDILVNNVGIIMDGELVEMEYSDWKKIFAVNVDSMFLTTKEVVKYMKRERRPVILNAGSVQTEWPSAGFGAYSVTKTAIKAFTKVQCAELARKGIRVAGYIPGLTDTPINASLKKLEPDRVVAQIPFRRMADPDEIANVIVFLASEQASYVGGSMTVIDGGKLAVQNPRRYDADGSGPNL